MKERLDYKLFFILTFCGLLPFFYSFMRLFIIDGVTENTFTITSQMTIITLLFEVIEGFLILPIYNILGNVSNNEQDSHHILKSGSIIVFLFYSLFAVVISPALPELLAFSFVPVEMIPESNDYLQFQLIALTLGGVVRYFYVYSTMTNRYKLVLVTLILSSLLSAVADMLFISMNVLNIPYSVSSLALSDIVTNGLILLLFIIVFRNKSLLISQKRPTLKIFWIKNWIGQGTLTGLSALIRNLFYFLFVIRLANMFQKSDVYWYTNTIIMWGALLVPITSLGTVIKVESAKRNERLITFKPYLFITIIIWIIWIISVPFWNYYTSFTNDPLFTQNVTDTLYVLIPFYMIFSLKNIFNSMFLGSGKPIYLLIQNIVSHISVYGITILLLSNNLIHLTWPLILFLFGAEMFIECIIALFIYLNIKKATVKTLRF